MTSASTVKTVYALVDGIIVTFSSNDYVFKLSDQECYKGFLWVESDNKKYTFMPGDWEYDRKILEDRVRGALLDEIALYLRMIVELIGREK